MQYLFLFGSVLLATGNNVLLHTRSSGGMKSSFLFNFYVSLVWIVMLFALLRAWPTITPVTCFYGCLYGVFQALFLFFKMQAMMTGPVSITTLIGNCSLILSTGLGVLIWQESVGWSQWLGVGLLIAAMVLCTRSSPGMPLTKKWGFSCAGFFVIAGSIGVIMKLFSKVAPNEVGSIILISAVVMAAVYLLLYFLCALRDPTPVRLTKRELLLALSCGLVSCGYNRLNGYLAGVIDSIIFYPVFNGATILLSVLCGCLLFKERFARRQIWGFIVGVIALLLAGNLFSVFVHR